MSTSDFNFLTGLAGIVSKTGIVIFLLLYLVFSFLVTKQVDLMTKTLEVGLESLIRKVAALHLLVSLIVLLYALVVL